jgi:hypothetical protein
MTDTTDVLLMSQKELNRLEILRRALEKQIKQTKAAELLDLTTRQTRRLMRSLEAQGARGIQSKKRGKPSNHRLSTGTRDSVLNLVRSRYHDFGPTLANEKLRELHGVRVSTETLRAWMTADGLWIPRTRRRRIHQPRNRRDCLGELVQIDGSMHHWFEDRSPKCTLLVFIDDATGRLMVLRFVPTESAFDYFDATKEYISAYGKPVAFYSDKHSIFRSVSGNGRTQFGRALEQLNVDILCANTPQAKGRVERANRTLQDRLVKELRLARISDVEAANAFLPSFAEDFNARFARPPRNPHNAHRPLVVGEQLHDILALQTERTITKDLLVHYKRQLYRIVPSAETRRTAKKRCTVFEWKDGTVELRCGGLSLPYTCFDKDWVAPNRAPVVENKLLGSVIELLKEEQRTRLPKAKLGRRGTKRTRERLLKQVEAAG